mmetsp:Transcript_61471/g.150441  ORF Transcript_61471/g.150441 Transcript_61471/m.150441 type:complete len:270 (-) Transcript_61471:233-1042(-)
MLALLLELVLLTLLGDPLPECLVLGEVLRDLRVTVLFLVRHKFSVLGRPFGTVADTPGKSERIEHLLALARQRRRLAEDVVLVLLTLARHPVTKAGVLALARDHDVTVCVAELFELREALLPVLLAASREGEVDGLEDLDLFPRQRARFGRTFTLLVILAKLRDPLVQVLVGIVTRLDVDMSVVGAERHQLEEHGVPFGESTIRVRCTDVGTAVVFVHRRTVNGGSIDGRRGTFSALIGLDLLVRVGSFFFTWTLAHLSFLFGRLENGL